jgi:Putative transposase
MNRPPLEMADLIRAAGAAFIERNRHWLRWKHVKVLRAIARCRYIHRLAISNHRLVSFADGQVTFLCRDSAHHSRYGNPRSLPPNSEKRPSRCASRRHRQRALGRHSLGDRREGIRTRPTS